jgi:hypothetical protein
MRFIGACLLGSLVLVLTVGGIIHLITEKIQEPHLLAQQLSTAKRECASFFTDRDSVAIFGSAPTAGKVVWDADFGLGGAQCELTIPYGGQPVTALMGYACKAPAVNATWNSNQGWSNLPRIHGLSDAVDDASSYSNELIHSAAERFRARGITRVIYINYSDSNWIPSNATTIDFLKRTRSHVSTAACAHYPSLQWQG